MLNTHAPPSDVHLELGERPVDAASSPMFAKARGDSIHFTRKDIHDHINRTLSFIVQITFVLSGLCFYTTSPLLNFDIS